MTPRHLGLRMEYSPKSTSTYVLFAFVKVGLGVRSRNFFTTPQIRDALQKSQLSVGTDFGNFLMVHTPAKKELAFISYYPHPTIKIGKIVIPGKFSEMGIASALEARLVQVAKEYFPHFTHVTHPDPTDFRVAQLMKRGHTLEETRRVELAKFEKNLRQKRTNELVKALKAKRAKRIAIKAPDKVKK